MPQYANVDANNRVDIRNGEGMLLSSLFRISSILLNALHIFQKNGIGSGISFVGFEIIDRSFGSPGDTTAVGRVERVSQWSVHQDQSAS